MILFFMIAATVAQVAPPSQARPAEANGDEIIVVGERIRRIRLVTRHDRKTGKRGCVMRRSSGVADLDIAVCAATLACAATATREDAMVACLSQRMPAISEDFARRRRTR